MRPRGLEDETDLVAFVSDNFRHFAWGLIKRKSDPKPHNDKRFYSVWAGVSAADATACNKNRGCLPPKVPRDVTTQDWEWGWKYRHFIFTIIIAPPASLLRDSGNTKYPESPNPRFVLARTAYRK